MERSVARPASASGGAYRPGVSSDLNLGLLRVVPRAPAVLWARACEMAVIKTGPLGFAGAADDDRMRYLNSFRRLLDGLDGPLQVVIEVTPGSGTVTATHVTPVDFDEMRPADMSFVDEVSQSPSAHRFETSLTTRQAQVKRLEPALREIGVSFELLPPTIDLGVGKELAHRYLHSEGHSCTWYVERLPGTELEAGWLYRLPAHGLKLTLFSHAPALNVRLSWPPAPPPDPWIVDYLQRPLVNMRATRLLEHDAGTADPILAGAVPNTEDLQRRLASSPEQAFHVALYIPLPSPPVDELAAGSIKVEAAARAILCQLQPCTFRMFDGYLATQPAGVDRLGNKRGPDT